MKKALTNCWLRGELTVNAEKTCYLAVAGKDCGETIMRISTLQPSILALEIISTFLVYLMDFPFFTVGAIFVSFNHNQIEPKI